MASPSEWGERAEASRDLRSPQEVETRSLALVMGPSWSRLRARTRLRHLSGPRPSQWWGKKRSKMDKGSRPVPSKRVETLTSLRTRAPTSVVNADPLSPAPARSSGLSLPRAARGMAEGSQGRNTRNAGP